MLIRLVFSSFVFQKQPPEVFHIKEGVRKKFTKIKTTVPEAFLIKLQA